MRLAETTEGDSSVREADSSADSPGSTLQLQSKQDVA